MFHTLNAATVRIIGNQQYLLQYGLRRPHIIVPISKTSPRSSPSSENLETHSSSPTSIYWPSPATALLRSWEFSTPSSAFIPALVNGDLDPPNTPPFMSENINPLVLPSLRVQDVGAQISHVVSPETLHFSALSSPHTNKFPDIATCFVAKTGHDEVLENQEIISGERDRPCDEQKLPVELGHHLMQNVVLLLAMKIVIFKLIIFDLLMTGAALVETCREFLQTPKFPDQ
ncbi:uncharacterized protein LOC142663107 [Rhinoderma darwinii]|uniref:uncharacterized protein LOC142663107 n=1 Tax=Rhinoderma darwinii TaxID=43563 RepID=UPI003F66403B